MKRITYLGLMRPTLSTDNTHYAFVRRQRESKVRAYRLSRNRALSTSTLIFDLQRRGMVDRITPMIGTLGWSAWFS